MRGGRLGRFLLAERLFEGASQLHVGDRERQRETVSRRGTHSEKDTAEREEEEEQEEEECAGEGGGTELIKSASESEGERELWVDCLMT